MGEYVNFRGHHVKLGTCEDLYYARYEQIKEALPFCSKLEGNMEPREYLEPKNGFRYRFPFPDEDNTPMGNFKECHKGFSLPVPNSIISELGISFGQTAVPSTVPLEIVQQKIFNGRLITIIYCEGNREKYRIETLERFEQVIAPYIANEEVKKRALAGYNISIQ
jgi:hypothetical protein